MSENKEKKYISSTQQRYGGGRGPGRGGGPRHMVMVIERPKNGRGTFMRLLRFLRPYTPLFCVIIVSILLASLLSIVSPRISGRALDYIAQGFFDQLPPLFLLYLGLQAVLSVSHWAQHYIMAFVSNRVVRDIRNEIFKKIQKLPISYFDTHQVGDMMSRMVNDVDNVSRAVSQTATNIISALITIVGVLYMMLNLSWLMTIAVILLLPLNVLATLFIAKRTRRFYKKQQETLGELNGYTEEMIAGQKVVKVFSREETCLEEFDGVNRRLQKYGMQSEFNGSMMGPVHQFINNFSFALLSVLGALLARNAFGGFFGTMSVGEISAFLDYSRQFSNPITQLANQYNIIQSGLAGAERIFALLDAQVEVDTDEAHEVEALRGDVDLNKVDFSYVPEKQILHEVEIHAKAGQTIALVGPTGAGKTTIVNLLMRFYDISGGQITIDGEDISLLQKESLRKKIGIVLQDTTLFADTVRENIRYGRLDATDAEVENAARYANADVFIRRLENGYDTMLAENGSNLSQGQRQLLSIARAVLANPSILILDEATSSVDTRTEMHIQMAMIELMKGRTSFVIAHRLSTIRGADKILVLSGGRIVEQGDHEQLLAQNGVYKKLYDTQFRRQEELENELREENRAYQKRPSRPFPMGGMGF